MKTLDWDETFEAVSLFSGLVSEVTLSNQHEKNSDAKFFTSNMLSDGVAISRS